MVTIDKSVPTCDSHVQKCPNIGSNACETHGTDIIEYPVTWDSTKTHVGLNHVSCGTHMGLSLESCQDSTNDKTGSILSVYSKLFLQEE